MRLVVLLPLLIAALTAAGVATIAGLLWLVLPELGTPAQTKLVLTAAVAALLLGLAGGLVWALLHVRLVRPLQALARDIELFAHGEEEREPVVAAAPAVPELAAAVQDLLACLDASRRDNRKAVEAALRRGEEQKRRLEAILLDLSEGVIVCSIDHRILLYNQAAARILGHAPALGLGQQVGGVISLEPITHMLEQLHAADRQPAESAPEFPDRRFVCTGLDTGALLQARLGLVRDGDGAAAGYVLTFTDIGADLDNLARRDTLLREVTLDWRATIANLAAAAEMIGSRHTAMTPEERAAFEQVIAEEAATLGAKLDCLTQQYDALAAGPWPMNDVHSLDLFRAVAVRLQGHDGIALTPVGLPLWLHADSHALVLALDHLIRTVSAETGQRAFDIEALLADRHVYVQIAWEGQAIPSSRLDAWLDMPLQGTVGNRTAREVIERHGGEIWSQSLPDHGTCVRIPLPAARRPHFAEHTEPPPPRPEFYDFDLFAVPPREALHEMPLARLHAVAFDTETTGLQPSAGDALVAIAGVRIVNGRILTGETFERLINPRRPIPPASIRFHGITDDMVRDKPPAHVVQPQFKAFAGDCVLVAYNAAFDMKFLQMQEEASGVRFDNPVLDVLLLSAFLHDHVEDHSLDATAARLGVEVANRHTALGDALATAAIFVRMIPLLKARGVETFGQATAVSSRLVELRRRQARI